MPFQPYLRYLDRLCRRVDLEVELVAEGVGIDRVEVVRHQQDRRPAEGADLRQRRVVDGDGVEDMAVGAFDDDDGGTNKGAVWTLLLKPDGSVVVP